MQSSLAFMISSVSLSHFLGFREFVKAVLIEARKNMCQGSEKKRKYRIYSSKSVSKNPLTAWLTPTTSRRKVS